MSTIIYRTTDLKEAVNMKNKNKNSIIFCNQINHMKCCYSVELNTNGEFVPEYEGA